MDAANEKTFVIPEKIDTNDENIDGVGIDLGTSRCFAAVNRRNGIETVVLGNTSERGLPSYVSFKETEEKCGQIAIQHLHQNVKSIVFDSKRIIGRKFSEVRKDSNWPFELINIQNNPILHIHRENGILEKRPEDIATVLLKHVKQKLDEFQGKQLTEAVITVPATFTQEQRVATRLAGIQAGWKTIHLLPEPIAASLAYFVGRPIPNSFKMLLFDFGGGTLDVCLMNVNDGYIHIINTGGDSNLGGRDFDNLVFDYFSEILKKNHQIDVNSKHKLKFKLLQHCMDIKHTLSKEKTVSLDVSDFNTSIEENTFIEITLQKFETLAAKLLGKINNVIVETITASEYTALDINKVLLAGGSSHMPMVKHLLLNIFKKAEHTCEENPDEIVAIGAAYYAYHFRLKELEILNSQTNQNINVVGIDFGNTNCFAAVNRKSEIEIVPLDNTGERDLLSYVFFEKEKPWCGEFVFHRMQSYSKSTIYDCKKIIGKCFSEVKIDINWPFKIINIDNKPIIQIGNETKSPEDVASVLLKHIKQKAEDFQEKELDEIVMTIPVSFNKNQKVAIQMAANLSGWKTVHFLLEPKAAALAYFNDRPASSKSNILLFDLGGSSVSICIFNMFKNKLKIISNHGDEDLGGRDFDMVLFEHFEEILKVTFQINIKEKDKLKFRLMGKCIGIKHSLSRENETG